MNILVIGLGVIGGGFAMALRNAGYRDILGVDKNPETLEQARSMGIIRQGSTESVDFLPRADLTILALYPHDVIPYIQKHRTLFKPGSIITDVTGVKMMVAKELEKIQLPPEVDFVMGHPMAGREKKGIEYATDQVFQNANYLLTPLPHNKPENVDMMERLVLHLGFGQVKRITPELHDEMISFTSQLPHALAVALINSDKDSRDTGSFVGDSYRELTRIAYINEDLWSELFLGNKENLLASIEGFEEELARIKEAVKTNDRDSLVKIFQKSSGRREKLNR